MIPGENGEADAVMFQGRLVTGGEAQYLLSSMDVKQGPQSGGVTFGEYVLSVFRLMTNAGIVPSEWLRWSLARMRTYMDGRDEQARITDEAMDRIVKRAAQKKADSLLRFTFPLRVE